MKLNFTVPIDQLWFAVHKTFLRTIISYKLFILSLTFQTFNPSKTTLTGK